MTRIASRKESRKACVSAACGWTSALRRGACEQESVTKTSNERRANVDCRFMSVVLPNGPRLSCAATIQWSQMEFFTTCAGGASSSRWLGSSSFSCSGPKAVTDQSTNGKEHYKSSNQAAIQRLASQEAHSDHQRVEVGERYQPT